MNKLLIKNLSPLKILIALPVILMVLFLSSCTHSLDIQASPQKLSQREANYSFNSSQQLSQTNSNLTKAKTINNFIGFIDQNQVNRIKNYDVLGSNIHSNQSIYNVAFFLPSSQYRNELHARDTIIKEIHKIYSNILNDFNLVLSDKKILDGSGRETYKIQGVDCLDTLNFNCQLDFFTTDAKIIQNPKFIYRKGGSYFVKLRVRLFLPKGLIDGNQFYSLVSSQLPNWTFNLVDYETDQVVHIQRGYQKYFF